MHKLAMLFRKTSLVQLKTGVFRLEKSKPPKVLFKKQIVANLEVSLIEMFERLHACV